MLKKMLAVVLGTGVLLWCGVISAAGAQGRNEGFNDWLLVPYERAGAIQKNWSIQEVTDYFGSESLIDKTIVFAGEEVRKYSATDVKAGWEEAICLVWTDSTQSTLAWVEVHLQDKDLRSKWRLPEGYFVGMPLREAELLTARRTIPFCGFYNGLAGMVPTAEYGGIYSQKAGVAVRIGFLDERTGQRLMGDRIRWSNSPQVTPYKDALLIDCIGVGMNQPPRLVRD